jgi:hypothetical protein
MSTSVLNGNGGDQIAGNQLHSQARAVFRHAVLHEGLFRGLVDCAFVRLVRFACLGLLKLERYCRSLAIKLFLTSALNRFGLAFPALRR